MACLEVFLPDPSPRAALRVPKGNGDGQHQVVVRADASGERHVADGGEVDAEVLKFRLQSREVGQVGGDFQLATVEHRLEPAHKLELRHTPSVRAACLVLAAGDGAAYGVQAGGAEHVEHRGLRRSGR